eukprot:3924871-Amphidinium_carterae.1
MSGMQCVRRTELETRNNSKSQRSSDKSQRSADSAFHFELRWNCEIIAAPDVQFHLHIRAVPLTPNRCGLSLLTRAC